MSDADPGGSDAETGQDRPSMSGDDMADPSPAEKIQADMMADADGDDMDMADADDELLAAGGDDLTIGDMYVNGLCILGNELTRSLGEGDDVPFETESGELDTKLAEQLQLNEYVDQYMAQHGGNAEMSPGQGILVGTAVMILAVLVSDATVVRNISKELRGELDNAE